MKCPAPELLAEAATSNDEAVLSHVAACAECQALLDGQREVHALLVALPDQPLTRDHRESLAAETLARADALPVAAERRHGADVRARGGRTALGGERLVREPRRSLDRDDGERSAREPRRSFGGDDGERLAREPRRSIDRDDGRSAREPRRWFGRAAIAVTSLALAALLALYIVTRTRSEQALAVAPPSPPSSPAPAPGPHVEPLAAPPAVAPVPAVRPPSLAPAPPEMATAKIDGTGDYAREARGDRDVVSLSGGDVTVDSVGTRAISVIHGDTSVIAKSAKAKVVAKRGVIAQVTVIAGSVEVTVGDKRVIIEQGMTWDRNGSREDSLAAFRTGWEALRAGDNAAALAAFDLATDDVVAEDALYWSAIASERLHDAAGAVTRYRALVDRFPKSPRVPAAEAAIARLAP